MDNTTSTEPQTAAENIPATTATPTAEPTAAEIAEAAPEPTAAPQIVENRDVTEPPTDAPEPKEERWTRQFYLGNGQHLIDFRRTCGGLDIIPEGPGVNFDGLPIMTREEAILAVLDFDYWNDAQKCWIVRQIVTATR